MRRSTKQSNSLHQQIKLHVVDLLVVLLEEVATLDGAEAVAMAVVEATTTTIDHLVKYAREQTMMHQGVIIGLISHTSLKIMLLLQQEFKLLHTKLIQTDMLIQEVHITSLLILIS
jgi:hypothetical protein